MAAEGSNVVVSNASNIWVGVSAIITSVVTGGFALWGILAGLRQRDRDGERKDTRAVIASITRDRDGYRRRYEASQNKVEELKQQLENAYDRNKTLEQQVRDLGGTPK